MSTTVAPPRQQHQQQQQRAPSHPVSNPPHPQKSSEDFNPASARNNGADSAYAASSQRTSPANTVPIENTGQIQGVDQDVNLVLNESTGEVVDEDTGEVITTVTTTTTTTTTTVRKGGRGRSQQREHQETKAHVETQPGASASGTSSAIPPAEGGGGIVEAPGDNSPRQPAAPRPTRDRSHSPAVPPPRIQTQTPPPPEQFRPRSPSPAPPQQQYPDAIVTDSTPLPPRSPHRRPADVPSPVRPNFSHPSRGHLRGAGTVQGENVNGYEERHYPPPSSAQRQEQALNSPALSHRSGFVGPGGREGVDENEPRSSTTFENLKTAAIGLHGVGETLRSTLNSAADSRFPRRDAEKNAYAETKNRAEMERGQREMARLRERRGLAPTVRTDGSVGGVQRGAAPGGSGAPGRQAPAPPPPPPPSSSSSQAPQLPRLQQQTSLAAPGTWGSGSISQSRPSVARGDVQPPQPSAAATATPAPAPHAAPPPTILDQQEPGKECPLVSVRPVTATHPALRRKSQGEQGFEHRAQNAAAAGSADSPHPTPHPAPQTGGARRVGLGSGERYPGGDGGEGRQAQGEEVEPSKKGFRGLFKRKEK